MAIIQERQIFQVNIQLSGSQGGIQKTALNVSTPNAKIEQSQKVRPTRFSTAMLSFIISVT